MVNDFFLPKSACDLGFAFGEVYLLKDLLFPILAEVAVLVFFIFQFSSV